MDFNKAINGDCVVVHDEVHEYDLAVILRVSTTVENRTAAVNYARQQARKPYNYNWLDKYRQDKFYCSQLVWASYYWTANIDLDSNGGLAVSPDNLFWDNNAYSVAIGF